MLLVYHIYIFIICSVDVKEGEGWDWACSVFKDFMQFCELWFRCSLLNTVIHFSVTPYSWFCKSWFPVKNMPLVWTHLLMAISWEQGPHRTSSQFFPLCGLCSIIQKLWLYIEFGSGYMKFTKSNVFQVSSKEWLYFHCDKICICSPRELSKPVATF